MKKEVYSGIKDRNIEKNVFVIFDIISKTKLKGKKTHGY